MPPSLTPQEFVNKWRKSTLKERAAAQEHFIDLCRLVGHQTPAEADPAGNFFTFEAGATKQTGGQGWADVWMKGAFAWEYKGKHKDLNAAYQQLLGYREDLLNPPLLIVSDMEQILIRTNFTNTARREIKITLDDLLASEGMAHLRAVFYEPEAFRAPQTPDQVTREAANEFAKLAEMLRSQGAEGQEAAHFLIRILFCLFSEDINLLPDNLFTQLVRHTLGNPAAFNERLHILFGAMAKGGWFGFNKVAFFDGRLFDDDAVLDLPREGLDVLANVATLNWATIKPAIFGTLFERGLDPNKRSQLGAHYTDEQDIVLIVEPVLMAPLRREWAKVQAEAQALANQRDAAKGAQRTKLNGQLEALLTGFARRLAQVRVLDPACGSGNFLYVALRLLLDLWHEVSMFASQLGLPQMLPLPDYSPSPDQLHGIEINPYARELAQATIWIGYIQWLHEHGFGVPTEPILKPLDNIVLMDAILAFDEDGQPIEPEWPEAQVIVGNPPFLGGKRIRSELGDAYVDALFRLYNGRVPRECDLVCYWFEKARAQIEAGIVKRSGLLATQAIRGGANRKVLERVKETGDIFWAESDRNWILDGATVHVSMVGFDAGDESSRTLNGQPVAVINANLATSVDLTKALRLSENANLSFMGVTPAGSFDVPEALARSWMVLPPNPNGRPNSAVLRPYFNGMDLTRRPRNVWIVDFGVGTLLEEAALYQEPFEYVVANVKPKRLQQRSTISQWWLHERPRPEMRNALSSLSRYIGTSMVSKHFLFSWIPSEVLPANLLIVVAREDDYFFGVLHSRLHELWARSLGTQLREAESGFRYTPTTTFETYPFPWPPGREPAGDPRVEAIDQAVRELVEKRDAWLNPPDVSEAELKKRTLTNLYNQRPTWLDLAHRKLDAAVLDAYGWPHDLSDEEILERLLALNLERVSGQPQPS
jgi:type II restriction/modification system DNA methylase subunit YeeA